MATLIDGKAVAEDVVEKVKAASAKLIADTGVTPGIAVVIVAGTWGLLRQSVHLLFDGVPESVDLVAVRTHLLAQPGVTAVADLHVWAMSTTRIALTAHLVVPGGHPGDDWLTTASNTLEERFSIGHATLQVSTEDVAPLCPM